VWRCFAIVVSLLWPAAASAAVAVEYYHAGYGDYFLTLSPAEMAALDAGSPAGWARTGESFGVFDSTASGAANVCRYWSGEAFAPRSSHFYTPAAAECAALRADPHWVFEGEVFAVVLPDAAGACPTSLLALYRLYNNGQGGAPSHRLTTRTAVRDRMAAQGWIAEGTGTGVIGCVPDTIAGRVIDGYIGGALVCLDSNGNGRCDSTEPQARSANDGAYELTVPAGSTGPLVAEIIAGQARDPDEPQGIVDLSHRMASPSPAYGADITPWSTLVHLTGLADLALAEDLVRDIVGLPPKFDIRPAAPDPPASLRHSVARSIVASLKTSGLGLDFTAANALERVVVAFPPSLTELPQLRITTRDAAPIVSREIYVDATYVLTNPAAGVREVTLNGRIRGRGHSTWGQPKNPYKVQFANDASYAAIADVLGMKKQRNWALLADYFDRSLMRNKLALSLGSSSVFAEGLKWTPSGQHLEVFLNGDYVGVYLLTEDIRIDAARLDLHKMSADPAKNDVDGGYIVEVDQRLDCYNAGDINLQLVTPQGVAVCIDTPDEESITPAQIAYVKALVRDVESDIYGPNRLDRINPESFVDWYILQELFRNNDAIFYASDYMWKDTAAAAKAKDRVLNMGPLWDFDRAAGNVNDNQNWETQGCWVSKPYVPNWLSRLLDNAQFLSLTLARWKQQRPALEVFLNTSIDTYGRRLAAAQQRNFERWPIFDVPLTNHYVFGSYDAEVAFLRQFLNERMAWMDKAFATSETFAALCK
jgi:hypothetical protein